MRSRSILSLKRQANAGLPAERLVESIKDVRQIRFLDIDPHPDLAYQHGTVDQNGEVFSKGYRRRTEGRRRYSS
jgi:hypothetical protein